MIRKFKICRALYHNALLKNASQVYTPTSNAKDSNTISNGRISLSFFPDHVSYSFADEIKKAISESENGVASGIIMTDATLNGEPYSGNGSVTSDGGHLVLPELKSGIITFMVFTKSGNYYKISCILKNGLPIGLNSGDSLTTIKSNLINTINNGQIKLEFFEDHVTYSFGDVVKKAINDNGGAAGSFMYTNATEDGSEFSGDGDVTTNGGHIEVPKLNNGIFTFVVTTSEGDFKISCTLKNGSPVKL